MRGQKDKTESIIGLLASASKARADRRMGARLEWDKIPLAYRASPDAGGALKGVVAMDLVLTFLNAIAAIATAACAVLDLVEHIAKRRERE